MLSANVTGLMYRIEGSLGKNIFEIKKIIGFLVVLLKFMIFFRFS